MTSLQSLIGRHPDACYTQIGDDEIVILSPVDSDFYHLNNSAVDLWLALDNSKTVLELTQVLSRKYLGDATDYHQDVLEWVNSTHQKGLLVYPENTAC